MTISSSGAIRSATPAAGGSGPPSAAPSNSALNVYKKVAIIRGEEDVLTYEDNEGNVKTVTDLHLAAVESTPMTKPKPKDDIPVPEIRTVETYQTDLPPDYDAPLAYVRHHRPSRQELRDSIEYVIDAEDEAWLHNNAKIGGSIPKAKESISSEEEKKALEETKKMAVETPTTIPLPLAYMEIMMDIMEKATGFEIIITLDQAEHLIVHKLPQLLHMYPRKGKSQVVTLRQALYEVYQYWVSKRSKLKRPLLRRFWPVTSTDDTNPHLVFRPREKEKYKLRKKRQNDMDAYRKMQQLKQDFGQVRLLLSLIKQREELNRSLVLLQKDWFEQKLYDAVDTSGLARVSRDLDRQSLNELTQVNKHYDVQEGVVVGEEETSAVDEGVLKAASLDLVARLQ